VTAGKSIRRKMESNEERHEALVTSGENDDEVKEPVEPEPWVRIQRTTFTNWINVKLREKPGMEVCLHLVLNCLLQSNSEEINLHETLYR
jgi:hypothetical protein